MLATLEELIKNYPLIASIISGIVSSAVFLLILSRLKPSIKISSKIAYDAKRGKSLFKIINLSPFFKVYDISASLYSIDIVQTFNGENTRVDALDLKVNYIKTVQRFNWKHLFQDFFCNEKRLKSRTDYAIIFVYNGDLREIINDHKFIRFEIYAKHTLTGFAKIFSCDYKFSGIINEGTFLSGNTFKIKNC